MQHTVRGKSVNFSGHLENLSTLDGQRLPCKFRILNYRFWWVADLNSDTEIIDYMYVLVHFFPPECEVSPCSETQNVEISKS